MSILMITVVQEPMVFSELEPQPLPRGMEPTVQTEPTAKGPSLLKTSNPLSFFFLHEGLDSLCFQGKEQLVELREEVERCCVLRGDSSWNQVVDGSMRNCERHASRGYLRFLEEAIGRLEERKTGTEYLLDRLNTWTVDDYPCDVSDALIVFKARSELLVYVAKVLGFTERWIATMNGRLGHPVRSNAEDLADEYLVEEELLSDTWRGLVSN